MYCQRECSLGTDNKQEKTTNNYSAMDNEQEMSLREIKLMSDFYLTTDIEKYRDTLFLPRITQV